MKFLKRTLVQRLSGSCVTAKPTNDGCWIVRGDTVEITLAEAPELAVPSGALRLEGKGLNRRILVIHGEDGEFYAFPNHCSHTGRRLDPVPGEPMVQCCGLGKSTFDYQGNVLHGVESTAIRPLELRRAQGRLYISIS